MSEVASFLPARRYASAGTSHVPVSVSLSVTSRTFIETDERIELVFGMAASFHLHYVKRKFGYSKIRVLPSGNLSLTPDLENFASV